MEKYKIFSVQKGKVERGAEIEALFLKGAGITIPAIIIGEEGRGRQRGVLPVSGVNPAPCSNRGKDLGRWYEVCPLCGEKINNSPDGLQHKHPETGNMFQGMRLDFAEIGQTKAGKPKLNFAWESTNDEKVIVVFRTEIGYRGGNSHTGDRVGWKCSGYGCDATGDVVPEKCSKCGAEIEIRFSDFPGEILVEGMIAQGDAGRAGCGRQMVALMPKGVVFRTAYSGRLYGAPGSHYYMWDGTRLLSATWDERSSADLF